MERTMKKCSSCNTYSSDVAEYCEYCGEVFYKKYKTFSEFISSFKPKMKSNDGIVFPFEKNRQLCAKIDQEILRIKDINNLLVNVRNETIKNKIRDIVQKINGYIDSLVKCRCDIEFIKIAGSLNALLVDSRKISSEDLIDYDTKLKDELMNVLLEIQESYSREYLKPYFQEKEEEFEKMIENMSVLLISSILSNTSIVNELEYSTESSYKNLEENIDNINYEIDRLSAELSM
jgi:hypothetical protein